MMTDVHTSLINNNKFTSIIKTQKKVVKTQQTKERDVRKAYKG